MANKTRAELRAQWIDGKRMTENTSVGAAVAFDDVWDSHFNLGEDGLQEVYEGGGTLVLNGTVGALLVSGDQDITLSSTDGGDILSISLDQTANTITTSVTDGASTTTVATTASTLDATNVAGTATIEFDDTTIKGTTNLDLVSNNPVEVKDTGGAAQRIKGATPVDVDDLATKDYVDSTILPGTGDVVSEAPPGSQATKVAIYSNLIADKFHIRETPATIDPTSGALLTAGDITSTAGNITSTAGNIISTVGNVEAGADVISTSNMTVGNNLDLSATDTIVSSTGSIDIKTLPDHIADTINPHATSIANIGSGTRAQLEAAVTDVTTFVAASDVAGGDLSGTYPTPVVSAITPASSFSCTLASIPANTYLFRNNSDEIIGTAGISGLPTGAAGGDLGGTYPNPEVVDLTISGETGGSLLYYNGVIWVQLPNGSAGEVLQSGGGVAAPTWQPAAGGGNVSSAVGPVGTELAVFNNIGTSIIESTTPLVVNLATGAINDVKIIDGHITLKDNTGFEPAYEEGRIYYANGAFNAYIDEADITLQIGQEFWIKVRNISGATIDNGAVVYISGASTPGLGDDLPTIELADASSTSTIAGRRVLGVTTHAISNPSDGYVTTAGTVRGLTGGTDTKSITAFADGSLLYLDPTSSGDLTSTRPEAPDYEIVVGNVLDASAGNLLVQITEAISTNDIGGTGGFKINSGALAAGQILEYNAGGFFENVAGGGGGGATNTVVGSNGITNIGDNVNADLAPTYGTAASTVTQGNDVRLSDARTPTTHAASHQNGGGDEIATVTPAADAIPKANGGGKLDGWISPASATVSGIMETATVAEVNTGAVDTLAVSPLSLAGSTLATNVSANNAKVTNATHTGDVTGATVLTIAPGAVDIPMLSATGTAGATTFLRGDNTWDVPAGGGGGVFTPTINSTTMKEVSVEADFGTATGGVITLAADTTYFVRGSVAITNEILVNSGNAIIGFNRDVDKLIYSGATNLITVLDNDFSIRNIGLCATNATGKVLDATNITVAAADNNGRTKVLELQNLKFENTTNVWTIKGFELVDISNCLVWYIADGTIGCQFQSNRHLEISSCEFYNWFEQGNPTNLDFYRQIEIMANFSSVGNGVVNINASIVHPELDQIGLYIEPTSTTGFGTVASNTFTDTNLTPNIHQETVTLTGTSGTANILIDRFQNYLATFDTSLTTTAANFVTAYGQELAFRFGITVTSSGADLIFTASQAGNIFFVTSTTNVSGNLAGTGVINTIIDGVLSNIDYNSQNTFIIQANQGLQNAGAKGGIIIQGNANALTAPTSYQVLNATNVGGSFTTSPYFPQGIKIITDRDACSITYNQKIPGSFLVVVNATIDGTNGFVTCRLRFTRGGVPFSLPFATGTVELKGAAETLAFSTLGNAEFGDIFDIEFIRSSAGTLTVTDYTLNGLQF